MNDDTSIYRLVTLNNGVMSLCSSDNNETFHPGIGPQAEADILYVGQLQMAERMRQTPEEFVVWDVGLGAGANAVGALRATKDCSGHLRLVSFDCTDGALRFAADNAAALGYLAGYEDIIAQLLSEHSVTFQNNGATVTWEFHCADFPSFLKTKPRLPAPHAIMFDAYSPAKNPSMWTLNLFESIFQYVSPERSCSLSTYSRSTMLRVSLMLAGFYIGSGESTGMKDETTIAANSMNLIPKPLDAQWLTRVRCSTGAEPLHDNSYRQAPISDASWKQLLAHPQWAQ